MHTTIKKKLRKKEYEVTFSLGDFQSESDAIKISGNFNGWNTAEEKEYILTKGRNKKFKNLKVTLPAGEYEYKYFDLSGHRYIDRNEAPAIYGEEQVQNEFGTTNARLSLPEL
jgi:hypothetical protein